MSLAELPLELLSNIFGALNSLKDLARCAQACKTLRGAVAAHQPIHLIVGGRAHARLLSKLVQQNRHRALASVTIRQWRPTTRGQTILELLRDCPSLIRLRFLGETTDISDAYKRLPSSLRHLTIDEADEVVRLASLNHLTSLDSLRVGPDTDIWGSGCTLPLAHLHLGGNLRVDLDMLSRLSVLRVGACEAVDFLLPASLQELHFGTHLETEKLEWLARSHPNLSLITVRSLFQGYWVWLDGVPEVIVTLTSTSLRALTIHAIDPDSKPFTLQVPSRVQVRIKKGRGLVNLVQI